jgi:hypothetical protein
MARWFVEAERPDPIKKPIAASKRATANIKIDHQGVKRASAFDTA